MKKVETFEGIVNGVKFASKDAMINYIKSMNEPITEYSMSTTTRFASDDIHEGDEADLLDVLEAPEPYDSVLDYVVPSSAETKAVLEQVAVDPTANQRVDKNLQDRMEFFCNKIEDAANNENMIKSIIEHLKDTKLTCNTLMGDVHTEREGLEKKLKQNEYKSLFLSNVAGYVDTLYDAAVKAL